MSLDDLAPCSGAHAVQSAVFAVEWGSPLPQDVVNDIRRFYDQSEELKRQFPGTPQGQRVVSVRIDENTSSVATAGEIGGFQFVKPLTAVAPARLLQVARENCLYIVHDYTRWAAVVADVVKAMLELKPYLVKLPITAIGLQYTDVFHWRAAPESLDLAEVLNAEGGLFPANVLARKSLWHSHHGYFEAFEEPIKYRLLENVNLDVVDNGGQRSIAIVTSHQAQLERPIYTEAELAQCLEPMYQKLHGRNKEILSSLLTEKVREKIKLKIGNN